MISFIHIGDIHLGLQFNFSLNREKALDRRRELWSSFERVVQYTKDKNIDFLFIAGDLFEERYFTLGDMKRVNDILNIARDTNIIIVAGNHDYLDRKSLYNKIEWEENITIFNKNGIEKKTFKDLNTIVYGYSWDKVEIKENKLFDELEIEDDGFKKILVIHGDVSNKSSYLPLDLKALEDLNMEYIALGHIHKPEKLRPNIAYCGSLEPLDFGETGPHGFMQGEIYDDKIKVDFIPFSKREFREIQIELNENMTYSEILKKITDIEKMDRSKDFFRINLKGYVDKDLNMENLEYDLEDEFYHVEIIDKTIADYDLESIEMEYKYSILGEFISSMKEMGLEKKEVKDALYYGLDALLKERVDL